MPFAGVLCEPRIPPLPDRALIRAAPSASAMAAELPAACSIFYELFSQTLLFYRVAAGWRAECIHRSAGLDVI